VAVDWRALVGAKTSDGLLQEAFVRLQAKGSKITNLNVGGVFRTLLEASCFIGAELYDLLATIVPQGYARYATGLWLVLKARDLGLEKSVARTTQGTIRFHRAVAGDAIAIPGGALVGTRISSQGERLQYRTIATVLPEGDTDVQVPIEATATGSRYNVAPGMIVELLTYVAGIDAVVNDEGWITREGTDDETDPALQDRCGLRWYELSRGAIRRTYEAWARSVPGVLDVQVDDHFPRGEGTLDVIIRGAGGQPTAELIAAVQAYIDARRPIQANVLVKGPADVSATVRLVCVLPADTGDADAAQAAVEGLVNSLLASGDQVAAPRLGIGRKLYRSRLVSLAMSVDPVLDARAELPTEDLGGDVGELVSLGSLAVVIERLSA
jgi:uncharacterized phage protein gp47/JayE